MTPLYWLVGLIEQTVIWLGSLFERGAPAEPAGDHAENDILLTGSEVRRSNKILEAIGRPQE